jgi:hypothetical protein
MTDAIAEGWYGVLIPVRFPKPMARAIACHRNEDDDMFDTLVEALRQEPLLEAIIAIDGRSRRFGIAVKSMVSRTETNRPVVTIDNDALTRPQYEAHMRTCTIYGLKQPAR